MGSEVVRAGHGETFDYAGQPTTVLAGHDGNSPWAACEVVVPPRFAGPVPHAHDHFDEAIYVVEGVLLVGLGYEEAIEVPAGSMLTALRGTRHRFSNPSEHPAKILGLWSPAEAGLSFMRDIGAVLPAQGPPDAAHMADTYARHASRLLPD